MASLKPLFYALILAIVCLKLALFMQEPLFSQESYYTLRQAQHIQDTYLPFYTDQNTLQRQQVFIVPALAYLYASLGTLPIAYAHLILIALSTIASCFIYLGIARYHTKNTVTQWLSLGFFASIPLSFGSMLHTVHSSVLMIPLLLLLTYISLMVRKQKVSPWVALVIGLLCLVIHPITLVWILGYLLFLLICWVERLNTGKQEREFVVLLSFSAIVWGSIVFAQALIVHKFSLAWKNIPLLHQVTQPFDVLAAVSAVGLAPLALTTFALFIYSRGRRSKDILLYISLMLTFLAYFLATFSAPTTALLYFAVFMSCTLPYAIEQTREYLEQTKFVTLTKLLPAILALLIILSSVIPATIGTVQYQDSSLYALPFEDFPQDQTIIVEPTLAQQLIYTTNATVVVHDHFIFNTQAQQDIGLIQELFQERLNADKLTITNKYRLQGQYIYLYNTSHPTYAPAYASFANNSCFNSTTIDNLYTIECTLVVS